MFQKLTKVFKNLHRGQKGMTGLETAIILIAFVTVASVLAYSVLSAGIFSAEKGKATIYGGLEQAQASMGLSGAVIAESNAGNTSVDFIEFLVALTVPGETVDMSALHVNVFSADNLSTLTGETWDERPDRSAQAVTEMHRCCGGAYRQHCWKPMRFMKR
jgi:flagellin FlaB